MYRFGRLIYRWRWIVLITSLIGAFGSVAYGVGVMAPGVLKQGGFDDPKSDSTYVSKTAASVFGAANPDVMLVYRSPTLDVDSPEFEKSVLLTVARLPRAKVKSIVSYWHIAANTKELRSARQNFVSADRRSTFIAIALTGKTDLDRLESYKALKDRFDAPGMSLKIGGAVPIGNDFADQMAKDLAHAEMISLPLVGLIGLMVFGSLAASLMPVFVGIFSICGALAVLRLMTLATDVASLAMSLVTMLAAGLAIDYSLFIISRYREEVDKGRDRETAMGVTLATAGRTVMFSGVTVSASMGGLLLFPQMFLRSIGLAGIAVIVVALLTSMVLLPAMLGVLGSKIEFGQMPWRKRKNKRAKPKSEETGAWYRLAHSVMRRPILYFVGVSAVLVALVWPFFHVQLGASDIRALPKDMPSRIVVETMQRDFPAGVLDPIDVLLTGSLIPPNYKIADGERPPNLENFRKKIDKMPGVKSAQFVGYASKEGAVRLSVTYEKPTNSPATQELVRQLRALPPPQAVDYVIVGGSTAGLMDMMDALAEALPKTAIFVACAIFILLFAAFGSIALPIKAILMNLLSIGASFGAIVWGFQDGHLAGVLNFTQTGDVDANTMILILAVVFGLSMDYEVFLLSRIREEWDKTHDNQAAVAMGLQQTGGIITSAAVLLIVVVAAFSTAEISVVKLLGVGLLVAIIVDATLVRSLLVPATMRFLGSANWWLPKPLAKLHSMIDLREIHDIDVPGQKVTDPAPETLEVVETPPVVPAPARPVNAGPVDTRKALTRSDHGFTWDDRGISRIGGTTRTKREIVANPDGPGWRWVDVEDEYAR
jgi:RND superfamily putative drug exporter